MKKNLMRALAILITLAMAFGPVNLFAAGQEELEGIISITSRFKIHSLDVQGAEFSMISEDGGLVIIISEDTSIYFEDKKPVRDALVEGQTLAELMDTRNMVVTYGKTTRSIPPQTSPISVEVLYEIAVPLPADPPVTTAPPGGALPFGDVKHSDWYYDAVVWAYDIGIMAGISDTVFGPDRHMTRAMLVTILWRYSGEHKDGESAFTDVEPDTWYTDAVAWASFNEIVLGYSDTIFGVEDPVTREQMYTILYRYMDIVGLSINLDEEMRLKEFADGSQVSDWAKEALFFMYDAGVMFRESSMDNNARPQENALRGEIATAMYFFDKYSFYPLEGV